MDIKGKEKKMVSIILAAGKGTRMNAQNVSKVCFTIDGKPVITHALETYQQAGFDSHYIVVGNLAEQVMQATAGLSTNNFFCYQAQQLGTGNAAKSAAKLLSSMDYKGDILIVAGDKVFEEEILNKLIHEFYSGHSDMVFLVGSSNDNPGSGRIVYSEDRKPIGNIEIFDIAKCSLLHTLKRITEGRILPAKEAESIALKYLKNDKKASLALGSVWELIKEGSSISEETMLNYFTEDDYYLHIGKRRLKPEEIGQEHANLSTYLIKSEALYYALGQLGRDNAQQEEYLTDIIGILAEAHYNVQSLQVDYKQQVMAFNTSEELEVIRKYYSARKKPLKKESGEEFRTVNHWLEVFKKNVSKTMQTLMEIYGDDNQLLESKRRIIVSLLNAYLKRYGDEKVVISRSPGRVNIMGRHIDHQGGFGNMMAVDKDVYCIIGPRDDQKVNISNLESLRFPDRSFSIEDLTSTYEDDWLKFINSDTIREQNKIAHGDWVQYVKAITARLNVKFPKDSLKGMNILVTGDIPIAAGLSSSSALLVAVAEGIMTINKIKLLPADFVTLCAESEWFVGTRGGSGDHAAMKFCKKGMISYMSYFPDKHIQDIPSFEGHHLIICNSKITARKTAGAKDIFNHRVSCFHIGRELFKKENPQYAHKISHLRDINTENLNIDESSLFRLIKKMPISMSREEIINTLSANITEKYLSTYSDKLDRYPIRNVVIYGFSEIERSRRSINLLQAGDVDEFGRWMNISHNGDRVVKNNNDNKSLPFSPQYLDEILDKLSNSANNDLIYESGSYSCSVAGIDKMVDIALSVEGVKGAQIAGAGLGGCIMVLVKEDAYDALYRAMEKKYYESEDLEPEMFICRPTKGSGVLNL